MKTWSLQDAKARFSELVNRARAEGPQIVSRRGEEAVVVMGIEDFRNMTSKTRQKNLVQFLRESPFVGIDPELFARNQDPGREIDL